MYDKAAIRALQIYSPYAPFGGYSDELIEEVFMERWLTRSARGRVLGMGARTLARGLFVYGVYDTIRLGYVAGQIYNQHLIEQGATEEHAPAFSQTHMVGMRN